MVIFKCKMCGGDLEILEGNTVCQCEYCGTKQTVPNLDSEKKANLFSRANRLRLACEFDRAYSVYESIVGDFPEEAEAYWGLVLCKFGIEYVDDPKTAKRIPTCHRSSFDSIFDDPNYDLTIEYASEKSRDIYRQEAKAIEDIRRGIIEISSKEEPYDIFICYKETDKNGDRTIDSVIAQDVYDALTRQRYRVFFARISLEDKLGREYEPYIFSALHSAKIMLVFGTSYDNFNAVWVKNEWSRFLKLMETDSARALIPCYRDIDAYDMPREFAKLQAQDMGKVGAIQDLLRGIGKIIKAEERTVIEAPKMALGAFAAPLVERAFEFLAEGEYEKAEEFLDKALDFEPKYAKARLGKLLTEFRAESIEDLAQGEVFFDESINYSILIDICDENTRAELKNATERVKENLIRKAENALCNGEWGIAEDYYKTVLDFDEQTALLGLLLCEFMVKDIQGLKSLNLLIFNSAYYQRLYRIGNSDINCMLDECNESIKDNIINSANEALEDMRYTEASANYELALEYAPGNQEALLGKLLVEYHVRSLDELGADFVRIDKSKIYQELISVCDSELKQELLRCKERIEGNIAKAEEKERRRKKIQIIIALCAIGAVVLFFVGIVIGIYALLSSDRYVFMAEKASNGYVITDFTDADRIVNGHLEIPAEIDGEPVVEIGSMAFLNCTELVSVTIPDSVKIIGASAFKGCENLESVEIPDGVTIIYNSAFEGCAWLESVTLPNSLTTIRDYVFNGCARLESIEFPNGLISIGDGAFLGCNSLTSIEIPDSVTSVGYRAFYQCQGLKELVLPSSLTKIGASAFGGCTSVESVTVPAGFIYAIPKNSLKNVVINGGDEIEQSAFYNCESLVSITLGESITSIGASAFYNCEGLEGIVISNNVVNIDSYAFYGCTSLTIYCEASSKPFSWSVYWNKGNCPVVWGWTE